MKTNILAGAVALAVAAFWVAPAAVMAQTPAPAAGETLPSYKPPPRGAPGGRVGGASRGVESTVLPTIDPLAPDKIAGQTANPSPTLYYFISRPAPQPLMLSIRAPNIAKPLVETVIAAPTAAGIQAVRLGDYAVQLQPGIVYTWSVALVLDPQARSKDIVASASILRAAPDPVVESAARVAAPLRRAGILAQAGFWYDALAAAVEGEAGDRHAALDALLEQVGLGEQASFDRKAVLAGK